MNQDERIDSILLLLYKVKDEKGMTPIMEIFANNQNELTIEELKAAMKIIKRKGFGVFQILLKGSDYGGQINQHGIDFVETDSFSQPGTSLLNLKS